MEPIIRVAGLSKQFELHHLKRQIKGCQNIDFTLQEGEFIGITGKSGSGKSTILKCIYRTYLPGSGQIFYNSKHYGLVDLSRAKEREIICLRCYELGYVSQFLNAMPRTTAREIVELALLEIGWADRDARLEAENILNHFELDPLLWEMYPNTFSGGEKLRLNIARAMVKRPRLLLLDEPTASLDINSKKRVKELLEKLKQEGTSMVGIFHDLEFMEGLCDKEFNMQEGNIDGQVMRSL